MLHNFLQCCYNIYIDNCLRFTQRSLHFVPCAPKAVYASHTSKRQRLLLDNREHSYEYKLACQPIVIHFNEQPQIHQDTNWNIIGKIN